MNQDLFVCSKCGAELHPNMLNMPKRELTTGERYMICPNEGAYAFTKEKVAIRETEAVKNTPNLEEMKKSELVSYAEENGIKVNPKDKVAEIREAIKEAM